MPLYASTLSTTGSASIRCQSTGRSGADKVLRELLGPQLPGVGHCARADDPKVRSPRGHVAVIMPKLLSHECVSFSLAGSAATAPISMTSRTSTADIGTVGIDTRTICTT